MDSDSCGCTHKSRSRLVQHIKVHTVTQSSPSPILSCVEKVPKCAQISLVPASDSDGISNNEQQAQSDLLRDVHISARLMEDFLELAKENTEKDLETCGVLGAFLESGTYYVTTLIIPKQEATSNSCEAKREEEYFTIQNERSLAPVGWIHTHPSQSCFMSSIDLHTHYSYQAMIPEAFAIVMAPTDTSRNIPTVRSRRDELAEAVSRDRIPHSRRTNRREPNLPPML